MSFNYSYSEKFALRKNGQHSAMDLSVNHMKIKEKERKTAPESDCIQRVKRAGGMCLCHPPPPLSKRMKASLSLSPSNK